MIIYVLLHFFILSCILLCRPRRVLQGWVSFSKKEKKEERDLGLTHLYPSPLLLHNAIMLNTRYGGMFLYFFVYVCAYYAYVGCFRVVDQCINDNFCEHILVSVSIFHSFIIGRFPFAKITCYNMSLYDIVVVLVVVVVVVVVVLVVEEEEEEEKKYMYTPYACSSHLIWTKR